MADKVAIQRRNEHTMKLSWALLPAPSNTDDEAAPIDPPPLPPGKLLKEDIAEIPETLPEQFPRAFLRAGGIHRIENKIRHIILQ